jgi:hypothetical protein
MENKNDGIKLTLSSNQDPLGIREVRLNGAGPSLKNEAEIVFRQWASQNGNGRKAYDCGKSEEEEI